MYDVSSREILEYHRSILADKARMDSYLRAIVKTVRRGDVVLDMGCGTGILSYFACLAGARRVYAVEQGPIIELAYTLCRQNGFQDRVVFLNDWSTNVDLPEAANVIVTETIGNIGFEEGILGWILDARERLLTKDGRMVPHSVELVVVPVENHSDYSSLIGTWSSDLYTLDFSPARALAANNLVEADLSPGSFLSEPASLLRVDLASETGADLSGESSFVAQRDGLVHGLGGWFRAELIPGEILSNAPPTGESSWSHTFFPLEHPLPVKAGDRLQVHVQTGANSALWAWQVRTQNGREESVALDRAHSEAQARGGLRQATNRGRLALPAYALSDEHRPVRSEEGEIELAILQMMDGSAPAKDIARRTMARFPTQFANLADALNHVCSVAQDFGRRTEAQGMREGGNEEFGPLSVHE